MKDKILDAVYIVVGSVLLSFAITGILRPNGLMTGGITGLSIFLGKVSSINYTYIYYTLSLIVLILTYRKLGKYEASKIIILSVLFPIVLMIFDNLNIHFIENDMFLASIYFGLIAGIGTGLILKRGYSSGGTDSIGKIIHRLKYPYISLNQIISTIDLIIILVSISVFDVKIALYAIITQLVLLKSVEVVLYGFSAKLVKLEIVSNSNQKINDYILKEIKRGVTKLEVIGGYTNEKKYKLITICSPRDSIRIKSFIADMDEKAFVTVIPVMSVWGEGLGFDKIKEIN